MKTVIASLALSLLVSATSFANPDKNPAEPQKAVLQSAVYPAASAAKIHVIVDNSQGRRVAVRLLNQNGQALAEQFMGKTTRPTRALFDLSELQDGTYQVEISNGETKEIKQVTLKTHQPTEAITRTIAMN